MAKRRIFGPEKTTHKKLKTVLLALSALLCLMLTCCYWRLPSSMAAITFWPSWLWAIPGLFLTVFGASNKKKGIVILVAAMWLAFLGAFAEEARVLVPHSPTVGFEQARQAGKGLRVISLNCAGGMANAAEELAQYKPDIVLLQESPSADDVKDYATKLFGPHYVSIYGLDCCVIARGVAKPALPYGRRKSFCTSTLIKLKSGLIVDVSSIRLSPPGIPWRLLLPDCWKNQALVYKDHANELGWVMNHVANVPSSVPVIVGGDFNGPYSDGCLRTLQPTLHDAYSEGGRGLGNTIINDMPVARYDKIWVSKNLQAVKVVAKKTLRSDHRAVVCDLIVKGITK